MFIKFESPHCTGDEFILNSSTIRGVYLTQEDCEFYCVQIETEHDYCTYDVCIGDKKKCKAVFDRITDGLERQNYFVKVSKD